MALPLRAETISLAAGFLHLGGQTPYRTMLDGHINVTVENGRAAFRLGLGESMCRMTVRWSSKGSTAPVEACLTRPDIDESQFNEWRHEGTDSLDPTLFVPLQSQQPVRARLFVRACHGERYRYLTDMTIPSLAFSFQQGLALSAKNVTLTAADDRALKDVARGCGNENAALPEHATVGIGPLAGTGKFEPIGDEIHQELSQIRARLEEMFASRTMKFNDATKLVRLIDEIDSQRRSGDSQTSTKTFDQLLRQVSDLLPPQDAAPLIEGIAQVRGRVVESVLGMVGVRPSSKCGLQEIPCSPTTLRVDASTRVPIAEQDGTPARPFVSIADALRIAASRGACNLSVLVAPGTYRRDLTITSDTFIGRDDSSGRAPVIIAGSIENRGPYKLVLESVALNDTPRAAIHAADLCAFTSLHNVTIERARDFGVDIDGGMFVANDVTVRSTRGTRGVAHSGVGIRIRGAAKAAMARVDLLDNDGQGLAVIGENTSAFGRAFFVDDNHMMDLTSLVGTVSALDGALLLMETSAIDNNQGIGLFASSARIHFSAGRVTFTQPFVSDAVRYYGTNIAAYDEGVLDLSSFTSWSSQFCGLQFAQLAVGQATDGLVSNHIVGCNINGEETADQINLRCLMNRTRYVDNEVNLDSARMPVPSSGDEPVDTRPCAHVPFVCTWCS